MDKSRLILVGGFLGAGKTTLLGKAARLLVDRGQRVGLITNDQAAQLVDTEILKQHGFNVEEVAGGCFCCRFNDLIASAGRLAEKRADVFIGEPVGSCTDLAATVLQPVKKFFADRFEVSPFSVLVDPHRLSDMLGAGEASPLQEKVLYIYGKQLEEADFILINKTDVLSSGELDALTAKLATRFPHARVFSISALNGDGVAEWLDACMLGGPSGARIASVDYDIYADGEAILGWLNASVRLHAKAAANWKTYSMELLRAIKDEAQAREAEVAHVKLYLTATGAALMGNLTSTRNKPFILVNGTFEGASSDAYLILNARVQIDPVGLKEAVLASLEKLGRGGVEWEVVKLEHFSPSRPTPTHRFEAAV